MSLWKQFVYGAVSSPLGPIFSHLLPTPALNIHYVFLKFMKLVVLGEGPVRIGFLTWCHLSQISKRTILVRNLRIHTMQMFKDAYIASVMLKCVINEGKVSHGAEQQSEQCQVLHLASGFQSSCGSLIACSEAGCSKH